MLESSGKIEVAPLEDQPAQQVEIQPESIPERIEKTFWENFNISREELGGVAGFNELSDGKKLLVLENLKQVTFGRIQVEADVKFRSNTAEAVWYGKIWQGISKQYQIAELQKATAEELQRGGLTTHGRVLQELVKGARNDLFTPDALIGADGKIELRYASPNDVQTLLGRELTSEEHTRLEAINTAITEFTNTPIEWSFSTKIHLQRTPGEALSFSLFDQKRKYRKTLLAYEEARDQLGTLIFGEHSRGGALHGKTLDYYQAVDRSARMNQCLNNHPDVETALQNIVSGSTLRKGLGKIFTERGIYASAGFISRSATIGVLSVLAVPLTVVAIEGSAAAGGVTAFMRGRESLRQEARMGRHGLAKTRDTRKLKNVEGEYLRDEKDRVERRAKKDTNFVDADVLSRRIGGLVDRINYGSDEKKRVVNTAHLKRLIDYTHDRLTRGLVNFGADPAGQIEKQYTLMDKLASLHVLHAAESESPDTRLEKIFHDSRSRVTGVEKKYLAKQIAYGITMGAGFAVAGSLLGELVRGWITGAPKGASADVVEGARSSSAVHDTSSASPPRQIAEPSPAVTETLPAVKKTSPPAAVESVAVPVRTFVETIKTGDSVWKIARRQLELEDNPFRERYLKLDDAQKTYVVDAIKDRVARDPTVFGLTNADQIRVGNNLDLTPVLGNADDMERIFQNAEGLASGARENILQNNELIKNWVEANPGKPLTAERVREILAVKATASAEPVSPNESPVVLPPRPAPHTELPRGVTPSRIESAGVDTETPLADIDDSLDNVLPEVKTIFRAEGASQIADAAAARFRNLYIYFSEQGQKIYMDELRETIEAFSRARASELRALDDPQTLTRYMLISEYLTHEFSNNADEHVRAGAHAFGRLTEFLVERARIASTLPIARFVFGTSSGLEHASAQFHELSGYFLTHGDALSDAELFEIVERFSSSTLSSIRSLQNDELLRRYTLIGDYLAQSQKDHPGASGFRALAKFFHARTLELRKTN